MRVQDAMTRSIATCRQEDTLNEAARIMWECDCGSVPVVDESGAVCGIVTDRDICMAAYTQGLPLTQIPVRDVMTREVRCCQPGDSLDTALELMQRHKVRRVPVTDGRRPIGILSIGDLTRALRPGSKSGPTQALSLVETLESVSEPRNGERTWHAVGNGGDVSRRELDYRQS
jgi:CBS domain-containing protein